MAKYQNSITKSLFFLVMAGLILVGCRYKYDGHFPEGEEAELVDRSLVTGDPCAPPCWYGLIPGESTHEEVMDTLKHLPFVDSGSIREYPDDTGARVDIDCSYIKGVGSIGSIVIKDGLLHSITTYPRYPLTLQELIELKGEPDGFLMIPNRPSRVNRMIWDVTLVWTGHGFDATVGTDANPVSWPKRSPIRPDMLVERVTYFPVVSDVREYLILFNRLVYFTDGTYYEWNDFEPIPLFLVCGKAV